MKKKLLKGFLILATISQVGYAGYVLAVDGPGAPPQRVSGTVDSVDDNMIHIRTDEGPIQSYSVSKKMREDVRALNEGDRVVLERDWMHRMVDVFPATVLLSSQAYGYRTIRGKVETFSPSNEQLTLKTREGETETFTVKGPAVRKMNSFKEGSRVIVEIDDENRVVDVRRG